MCAFAFVAAVMDRGKHQGMQAILLVLMLLPGFLRADQAKAGTGSSIQLGQLSLESMVFMGNASFGRTGQIELNNPILSASPGTPTISNGRALYNAPLQMLNPSASFETSFTFATLEGSTFLFVIVPNNQDLGTVYGFSVRFTTSNDSIGVWSGVRALATSFSDFDLGLDSRRTFAWVKYDSGARRVEVRASNLSGMPALPLVTLGLDLSAVFNQNMFVGFSASASDTSAKSTIYAWNFTSWIPNPSAHPDPASVSSHSGAVATAAASSSSRKIRNFAAAGIAVAALLVAVTAAVLIVRHIRSSSPTKNTFSRPDKDAAAKDQALLRRFTWKELASATNNFDIRHKLGPEPGVSQCYRGVLSDCMVAIKVVSQNDATIIHESLKLLSDLASVRHRNLVTLLGWCSNSSTLKSLLVYEFVPNGSLEEHLFSHKSGSNPLPWSHRHKAASGLAQALEHLHSRGLIHGNVKSSNVMLDSNFTARLGDYSLKSRMKNKQPVAGSMIVAGTFGYVAPEAVQTGKPSTQADVFAFGAVILELVCGRRALEMQKLEQQEECVSVLVERVWEVLRKNKDIEKVVDEKLGGLYDLSEMETLVTIGLACSDSDPNKRPRMDSVVKMLAGEVAVPRLLVQGEEAEEEGKFDEEQGHDGEQNKNKQKEKMKMKKKEKAAAVDHQQRPIEELLVMKDFESLLV